LHGLGTVGASAAMGLPGSVAAATRAASSVSRRKTSLTATAWLAEAGATLGLRLTRFNGSHEVAVAEAPVAIATRAQEEVGLGTSKLALEGATLGCRVRATRPRERPDAVDLEIVFRVLRGRLSSASVAVTLTLGQWSREAYVMIPGAVYGGNRFASRHIPFPPLATEPSDIGPHVPPIVSDIPRLNNQPGDSGLVLSAVDAAVPAICARVPTTPEGQGGDRPQGVDPGPGAGSGRGFVVLAPPMTSLGLTSLSIAESADRTSAILSIGTPAVRPDVRYGLCNGRVPSEDRGADLDVGGSVTLRLRVLSFACPEVQTLFDRWYEARRDQVGPAMVRHRMPLSTGQRLIEDRLQVDQWTDGQRSDAEPVFRTGADGSLALVLPALMTGAADARKRGAAVLDLQLRGQAPSGLFHAAGNGAGWWDEGEVSPLADGEARAAVVGLEKGGRISSRVPPGRSVHGRRWTHIGRNAEALHLACRQVLFLRKVDPAYRLAGRWRTGLTRAADAVVRLWSRNQQLGQYVNCETGDLVVGGSTAGALAPGALVLAARALETESYLRCAIDVAGAFHDRFVRAGLTLGGAPAALQCPDSRSASGLLESFVALGEATGDEIWFARAAEVAHQLASWIVAWDVPLPPESTLGRMGVQTTGAILVSAQDKWALPGPAGLSGDALFRLYRATGRVSYLELLRETIHNSSQYVVAADEDRPSESPERPEPSERPEPPEIDSRARSGWVAGRVAMGDAMGTPGDVPAATPSGTSQAFCLMAAVEVPSIYVQPDTGFVFSFDHVEARIKERTDGLITVSVTNPTRFEAALRIHSELSSERTRPLDLFPMWGARSLTLAAGATEDLDFPLQQTDAGP